jgi:hypothetical protein
MEHDGDTAHNNVPHTGVVERSEKLFEETHLAAPVSNGVDYRHHHTDLTIVELLLTTPSTRNVLPNPVF